MLEGPPDEAREVLSCADEDALATNGKMYYDHYIRACKLLLLPVFCHSERHLTVKKTKGRTPPPVLPRFAAFFRHLQGDDNGYVIRGSSDASRCKEESKRTHQVILP